ncbi:hypothetical protein [Muricauda sp. MAR_2010_75]|uniref:hypothetical protein n=1 Tax=Allomuricauda sp. MAR_2010_75 TaxID=1250232 RepID=UPI00056CCB88|nr:hypothetical protein [Muricauda sp. MAR_2010_75]
MVVILELLTMAGCSIIAFQDFRERAVLWICFPIVALLLAGIHISHVGTNAFVFFVACNVILVSCVLLILFLVTKYIFKKDFLDVSFGSGDMLFMFAFALGFPTVTFILLFVGSICFSLIAFAFLRLIKKAETVPLAGLMGIYLIAIILLAHLPFSPSLYIL